MQPSADMFWLEHAFAKFRIMAHADGKIKERVEVKVRISNSIIMIQAKWSFINNGTYREKSRKTLPFKFDEPLADSTEVYVLSGLRIVH